MIHLVHWKAEEGRVRAETLQRLGYEVSWDVPQGQSYLQELTQEPPQLIIIDLSRLPSQGRDLALQIRLRQATRSIPLVFVEGEPGKVSSLHDLLPDAVYTQWTDIQSALETALAQPPENPVVPESVFAPYAGKPLVEKLGIKPGMTIYLANPPQGFRQTLGGLPEGATLQQALQPEPDLVIWFASSQEELLGERGPLRAQIETPRLWIAWPKRSSGMQSDLTQYVVREASLKSSWVDYKITAIDETWSGLLFTRRKG